MTALDLLLFALLMLTLAVLPSSSVALVVARASLGGRTHGLAAAAGIVLGDLLYLGMALLGMSWVASQLGAAFSLVRYLAGAYLIWLGWQLWRSAGQAPRGAAPATGRARSVAASFAGGLLLTLSDIKAILFYASLLPQLMNPAGVNAGEAVALALITVLVVGGVKSAYALLAARWQPGAAENRYSRGARRAAGGLLAAVGLGVIVKT
jgi:threonine/homoserine/homoserine lactone efflux protein